MVNAMNSGCNAVNLKGKRLLDIVGTGGDGADTINISTASVVLAAASGCIGEKARGRSPQRGRSDELGIRQIKRSSH